MKSRPIVYREWIAALLSHMPTPPVTETNDALDFVYDSLEDHLLSGDYHPSEFGRVDELLDELARELHLSEILCFDDEPVVTSHTHNYRNLRDMAPAVWMSMLTVTLPWRDKLPSRARMASVVLRQHRKRVGAPQANLSLLGLLCC